MSNILHHCTFPTTSVPVSLVSLTLFPLPSPLLPMVDIFLFSLPSLPFCLWLFLKKENWEPLKKRRWKEICLSPPFWISVVCYVNEAVINGVLITVSLSSCGLEGPGRQRSTSWLVPKGFHANTSDDPMNLTLVNSQFLVCSFQCYSTPLRLSFLICKL